MASSIDSGKVTVNFMWQGPNKWHGGLSKNGLDVLTVKVDYNSLTSEERAKGITHDISAHIPDNLPSSTSKKLEFTSRKCKQMVRFEREGNWPVEREMKLDSLQLTAQQIRSLVLTAGFFEPSPIQGPAVMDMRGNITRQERVLRTDGNVPLQIPTSLGAGETYTFVLSLGEDAYTVQAELAKK